MLPDTFTPTFLHQLELLKIRSRRSFLGTRQGGHLSLKRGHGIEFSDYRKYELGDNPRHIDWGVYGRSDRLYVKRFQEEQALSVLIITDASASMNTPPSSAKWAMARDLSLALSYIVLMQQDSVSLCIPGSLHTPPAHGVKLIHHLGSKISEITPGPVDNFEEEIQKSLAKIRFPGVAIFISDFLLPLQDIFKVINLLRAKNLDVSTIQVLSPEDLHPLEDTNSAIAVDSESGEEVQLDLDRLSREEYKHLLDTHNRRLREFLADSRISCSLAVSDQALSDFVIQHLPGTGLLS